MEGKIAIQICKLPWLGMPACGLWVRMWLIGCEKLDSEWPNDSFSVVSRVTSEDTCFYTCMLNTYAMLISFSIIWLCHLSLVRVGVLMTQRTKMFDSSPGAVPMAFFSWVWVDLYWLLSIHWVSCFWQRWLSALICRPAPCPNIQQPLPPQIPT